MGLFDLAKHGLNSKIGFNTKFGLNLGEKNRGEEGKKKKEEEEGRRRSQIKVWNYDYEYGSLEFCLEIMNFV